ncbi:tetratricopeptide repeat-containing diguanylate cyclase [Amedibacillus sp. YH-ame6]
MSSFPCTHAEHLMKKILKARYNDYELEKSLSLELLTWANDHNDTYSIAFSYAYLGDYYLTQEANGECVNYLIKARNLAHEHEYNDLLIRIYSLLGLYYESIADEQSSLEYNVEGLIVSHELKDEANEALILNNIAYSLQRRGGYKEALQLYEKAYELVQKNEEEGPLLGILLNNLATASTFLMQLEQARKYIMECEKVCFGTMYYEMFRSQNWCQYFVALRDIEKSIYWADYIIKQEVSLQDGNFSFDIHIILFDCMMEIKEKKYAAVFLSLMKKYHNPVSFDHQKQLEIRKLSFCIEFEHDQVLLNEAYKNYSKKICKLNDMNNRIITKGLNEAIDFLNVTMQKEVLKDEYMHLDKQVNLDELTKVYSRKYLDYLIHVYDGKETSSLGVIMIDVDCLKEFNDSYGHLEGDKTLMRVGSILKRNASKGIFPCRFGGDEFICLCADCTDDEILHYVHAIRDDLEEEHILHQYSKCSDHVTFSIGFCNEEKKVGLHTLLQVADQALYSSKFKGRNTYSKEEYKEL